LLGQEAQDPLELLREHRDVKPAIAIARCAE
jgi:hypothetical protein